MTRLAQYPRQRDPVQEYEARSCPFCGAMPYIQPWHGGRPTKKLIGCQNEECDVQPGVCGETRREALERWNRRA